jgi:hypothetical protein
MRPHRWIGAFLLTLIAGGQWIGGEPECCEPAHEGLLRWLGPAGGWHPYGGGLLRWWDLHCFPRCGAPDDYCRKKLPLVCWPPYPPYYVWGPPEICCPQRSCGRASNEPH